MGKHFFVELGGQCTGMRFFTIVLISVNCFCEGFARLNEGLNCYF